jgi:hypothetical protein
MGNKHVTRVNEAETERLRGRLSNMDLFKKIKSSSALDDDPDARAPHCCYIHLTGHLPDLDKNSNRDDFKSETVEKHIDKTILYENLAELIDKREEYAVFEDNLAPTLEKMIHQGTTPSFDRLYEVCGQYEKEINMINHYVKCKQSYNYFVKKNVEIDEAKAYAFAIAFYTGTYSETLNQNTALMVRNQHRNASTNTETDKIDERATIIMHYLIKGLSHIDFYWGVVTRCVQLSKSELDDYKPGFLITWLQFSSSNKGLKPPTWCLKRNTVFFIYSLTGRSIQYFSNYDKDEDEVLFLPHSSFLVCHVETVGGKNHIYLRQVSCIFLYNYLNNNKMFIIDRAWSVQICYFMGR